MVKIIHYDEHIFEVFDLDCYLYLPSKNLEWYHYSECSNRYSKFAEDEICTATMEDLPDKIWYEIYHK